MGTEQEEKHSRLGLWDRFYKSKKDRKVYDDPATAKIAGALLNQENIQTIQDWGCGYGGFKDYIGEQQTYIGVDGSKTRYADVIADLEEYTSDVDAVHVRHILEHNPGWLNILNNSLKSFNKRMVLTLFTPYQDETKVIHRYPNFNNTGVEMVDIGFARNDLISRFEAENIKWTAIENIKTETLYHVEHIFLLEK
jgi:hypothetical protein